MRETFGQFITATRRKMNDNKRSEALKRNLSKLEEKVSRLGNDRDILINLINELKTKQNFKLINLLKDLELEEEISYLKGLIKFYKGKIRRYENRIILSDKEASGQNLGKIEEEAKSEKLIWHPNSWEEKNLEIDGKKQFAEEDILEQQLDDLDSLSKEATQKGSERQEPEGTVRIEIPSEEELEKEVEKAKIGFKESERVRKEVKELFAGQEIRKAGIKERILAIKKPIDNIFESIKLGKNIIKYAVPVVMLLLIFSVLFISKPQITGYVTLAQEKAYEDNLNLSINESGNYTWNVGKTGEIKSIKANGKVRGNGTVKVYIEKNGEKYLIFDNKNS